MREGQQQASGDRGKGLVNPHGLGEQGARDQHKTRNGRQQKRARSSRRGTRHHHPGREDRETCEQEMNPLYLGHRAHKRQRHSHKRKGDAMRDA